MIEGSKIKLYSQKLKRFMLFHIGFEILQNIKRGKFPFPLMQIDNLPVFAFFELIAFI